MSLTKKVAIVTGASSGIGAGIAIKFAEEGAKVVIVGRNESKLKNVSGICEKRGSKPLTIVADVSKEADAKRIINETIDVFGHLDILVNNAGIGGAASILDDHVIAVYDKIMEINLRSVIYLTHLAAKHIIETKGNIINISSIVAQGINAKGVFLYGASKAALDHFTKNIAYELGSTGVRVNAINPGPVATDFFVNMGLEQTKSDDAWKAWEKGTVLKRIGESEEIGDLAVFLASDKARSITGTTMITDNGALLLGPIKFD